MIKVKEGVQFVLNPAGLVILQCLRTVSKRVQEDLTITSGSDGEHSGPDDPHYRGEAYDVRSHDLEPNVRARVLGLMNLELGDSYYGFLEDAGGSNEHFHFQVKKGSKFNLLEFLAS